VILDSIILENFGVYGGRQEVILTPEREGRPIILFGGLNGGGKTTFLDAVQLAFYGSKARCSNRGKLAYRDYLRATINREADPSEGASLAIHFRRAVDGKTHSYRLLRAWREGVRDIEETVDVLCDGEPDTLLSEHWEEYIESYIPSGISHLFFFDAEQIKELAEGEHAAELLGTAIHSLLGLDLVGRLDADLIAMERRKKVAAKTGENAKVLKHAEEEVDRLDGMLEAVTQEKAGLTCEVDQLTKAVALCEERFRLEGGDLFVRRGDLASEMTRFESELGNEEHALRELAGQSAPLLLVESLLAEVVTQAAREVEARKADVIVTALEERDDSILYQLRTGHNHANFCSRLEAIFRKDRQKRRSLLTEPRFIDADDHLLGELRHLTRIVLPETSLKIASRLDAAAKIRERISRLETTLARVPAEEAIARLQRELETWRVRRQQKQAEVDAIEAKLQIIVRQRQAADDVVRRLLAEDSENQFGREDGERLLKHSAKVRVTLSQFRTVIIRKHAVRIQRLMLDAFTQLLRKSSLVTDLKIDPETFRIELTGGDGRPLSFDRLSAGERQLLATSLLWGLARASGRSLPTIIDTPLGRLDSSHRRHLIERYFPVASHQVILLSTDEEIDEDSLKRLKPHIGRTYHLQFNEVLRTTQVTPGYFWNHETTP